MAAFQSSIEGHPPKPATRSFLDIFTAQSSTNFQPRPSSIYRGRPSVAFSDEDIARFLAPFHHALIGKFSNGRPPMESIRKSFISIGFSGSYTLGLINHKHILIKFQLEDDYVRSFLKRIYSIDGFTMRLFKWSPQFSVDTESAILPIWINLPLLPLHFFHKEALYNIAKLIGTPLKMDASTTALTRPSVARVCVELDLRKSRPEKIWIVNGDVGFWQPIDYENIPPLCSKCSKIGHHSDACRSTDPRPPAVTDISKEPLLPKARWEYRLKNASDSNLQRGHLPVETSTDTNAAAEMQGVANCAHGADVAAEAQISGETLPAPFHFPIDALASRISVVGSKTSDRFTDSISSLKNLDYLSPDLLAVSNSFVAELPLTQSNQMDIADTHMSEVCVHYSVQLPDNSSTIATLPTKDIGPALVSKSATSEELLTHDAALQLQEASVDMAISTGLASGTSKSRVQEVDYSSLLDPTAPEASTSTSLPICVDAITQLPENEGSPASASQNITISSQSAAMVVAAAASHDAKKDLNVTIKKANLQLTSSDIRHAQALVTVDEVLEIPPLASIAPLLTDSTLGEASQFVDDDPLPQDRGFLVDYRCPIDPLPQDRGFLVNYRCPDSSYTPFRGRGKKKQIVSQSDRVMRPRQNNNKS